MLSVKIRKKLDKKDLAVDFEVGNDFLGIVGASGAGKSMTLKCIAGIERPDEGRIVLDDKVLFDSEKNINVKPQERHIGYLFQNYELFPQMTVWENIYISVNKKYYKNDKKDVSKMDSDNINKFNKNNLMDNRAKIVNEALDLLNIKKIKDKYPSSISGGEQQRVALARIIVNEPELLLLDEPFSSLDTYLKWNLAKELKEVVKGYGKGIIFVTHGINEIYYFCNDMLVLSDGKIVESGKVKNIIASPQSEEGKKLINFSNLTRDDLDKL